MGRLVLWRGDLLSQDGWVQGLRISCQDQKTKREAKRAADILGQHRLVIWERGIFCYDMPEEGWLKKKPRKAAYY